MDSVISLDISKGESHVLAFLQRKIFEQFKVRIDAYRVGQNVDFIDRKITGRKPIKRPQKALFLFVRTALSVGEPIRKSDNLN